MVKFHSYFQFAKNSIARVTYKINRLYEKFIGIIVTHNSDNSHSDISFVSPLPILLLPMRVSGIDRQLVRRTSQNVVLNLSTLIVHYPRKR